MKWFRYKHKKSINIGLDLSETHIAVVALQSTVHSVSGMFKIIIPFEKCIGVHDALCLLKRELQSKNLGCNECVVAMPDYQVMSKVIQLDKGLSHYALDMLVWHEAEQQMGYPMTEINLDYQCLGPSIRNAELMDVLLIASQKKQVNERLKLVGEAGLKVKQLDVESYVLARTLNKLLANTPLDNITAIVYLQAEHMMLSVWQERCLIFSRTEPMHFLADDIQQKIIKELNRLLQFYYVGHHAEKINRLYLAGSYVELPNLIHTLTQQLDIEIILFSTLFEKNLLTFISPEYVMAAALALSAAARI